MRQPAIHEIISNVRHNQPLIHCITNPISIHQCANGILAVGGRPMMAEHPKEVAEITATADALMLNLGNITDVRMASMQLSAVTAKENGIPIVLDAVGIACSRLRRDYMAMLLSDAIPTVIKGNYSEIYALLTNSYYASGVDAENTLDIPTIDRTAITLARAMKTIILASGKVDIVTDGTYLIHIHNGAPQLSCITGTGCMLGALCATFLSAGDPLKAVTTACAVLGICGEKAQTAQGNGTFLVNLMDALSNLSDLDVQTNINLEEIDLENI